MSKPSAPPTNTEIDALWDNVQQHWFRRREIVNDFARKHGEHALAVFDGVLEKHGLDPNSNWRDFAVAAESLGKPAAPFLRKLVERSGYGVYEAFEGLRRVAGKEEAAEALQTAMQHPEDVARLQACCAAFNTINDDLRQAAVDVMPTLRSAARKELIQLAAFVDPAYAASFVSRLNDENVEDRRIALTFAAEAGEVTGHAAFKDGTWRGKTIANAREITPERLVDTLLPRLQKETDAKLRDEILKTLGNLGADASRVRGALPPRSAQDLHKAAKKVKKLPGSFLDEELLPPLPGKDGQPLAPELVRYLLNRQSKEKLPRPDVQAMDVYEQIDTGASGDFAHHVLEAADVGKIGKRHAWTIVIAGMLGDARITAELAANVPTWLKKKKNALPEFGAVALGMLGTDEAVSALVGLADLSRNGGNEATRKLSHEVERILARAAAKRGVSREDLEDQALADFGFPADGSPRRIAAGKRTIDARIGPDFKLAMTDADTGKRVASVPKAAGVDMQNEIKALKKLLVPTFKQQTRRFERLMLEEHRWAGEKWTQRFLGHPVLFPYAQRLIWATIEPGRPARVFRAMEDRTLTDADDEAVDPPTASEEVAIVHPLRLASDVAQAWQEHVDDYEVEPPFEQLSRPTAVCPEALKTEVADARCAGKEVGFFVLRSKLQKFGWVADYGFSRSFPAEGIVAVLDLEEGVEAYYADAETTIKLRDIRFVPAGERSDNPLRLGDVPSLVYSEAVGSVHRVAGLEV